MSKYFLFIAVLHLATTGPSQGDSLLLQAALNRDFSAWQTAQKAPGIGSVWEPFVTSTPPDWANYEDSAMWLFAQWAAPTIAYADDGTAPETSVIAPPGLTTHKPQYAWVIALASGIAAMLLQLVFMRTRTVGRVPGDLANLNLFLAGNEKYRDQAETDWKEWSDSMTLNAQFMAALAPFGLTKTEGDVATKILADLSVQEIARDLNCTTAYVYNVRSSLRKKLNSNEDLPLERQLKKLLEQPV